MERTRYLVLALALAVPLWLAPAAPAHAGCGCDHPLPAWTVVMPPFGAAGKQILVFAEGGSFTLGASYVVNFSGRTRTVTATLADRLEVALPPNVPLGPVAIRVTGPGYDVTYPNSAFTALPNPRKIREREGIFQAKNYQAAIGSDGTLYLPLDLKNVLDAMQFMLALYDLPLDYSEEDVVIYNADGFDLTLFTLDVGNAVERQWGSYYGWSVEDDTGIHADFYRAKTKKPVDLANVSDLFTYWRHEFHTYAAAHAPGGAYAVDVNGFHADGTRHIDHSNLVIAISGKLRNPQAPLDLSLATPLEPGSRAVHIGWISKKSPNPIEPSEIATEMPGTQGPLAEALEEVVFQN